MKMITKFFSNKHNLYGLMVACYTMLGVLFNNYFTAPQVLLAFVLILFSNLLWYMVGMGHGIFQSELRKGHWRELLEQIDELNKIKNKKSKKLNGKSK